MRFSVRSLGGKLVISAALMLLLCMLLFSLTSWYFLKSFYEHEAFIDANKHLPVITLAYKSKVESLTNMLSHEASKAHLAYEELHDIKQAYNLTSIFLISDNHVIQLEDGDLNLPKSFFLITHIQGSGSVSALEQGNLELAVPVKKTSGQKS